MKNYNAKLGRTLTTARCSGGADTSKRLAALSLRRQDGILQRFRESLVDGRFEFMGAGSSAGNFS